MTAVCRPVPILVTQSESAAGSWWPLWARGPAEHKAPAAVSLGHFRGGFPGNTELVEHAMKPKSTRTPHPHSSTPSALCFLKLCSASPVLWAAAITTALLLAVSPAELAQNGFWDYLSQLTSDKDSLEQAQGSKLGRQFT